ncbi:endolytic transglycosylase MltG [Chloracidobacterium sp. S]|uniref:endolytic transglycosylase MltG n=1 Tax=Chloracidobacterium aggregatum TaxID=2851959 RepID=UPI001B8B0103|nr:endolytic transglycosylase MltG [Chloracidobacterium aggregatum]QUV87100.1 endolytic transglycosylase MltG [Chloracidobacterium sp. S]
MGFLSYRSLHVPFSHRAADELITIEPGMGAREVVELLYERGIIPNRPGTGLSLMLNPAGRRLQAGDYEFESPIAPLAALEKIRRGAVATRRIMFRPGLNIYEVNDLLPNRPASGKLDPALLDVRLIADLDPQATSLEGYIFPDTYIVPKRATNAEILAEAAAQHRQRQSTNSNPALPFYVGTSSRPMTWADCRGLSGQYQPRHSEQCDAGGRDRYVCAS